MTTSTTSTASPSPTCPLCGCETRTDAEWEAIYAGYDADCELGPVVDEPWADLCHCGPVYHAVKVLQGAGRAVARQLRAAGYHVPQQGYSDGSTTWTLVLGTSADEHGAEPVELAVAQAALALVQDGGCWAELVQVPLQ